MKGGGQGDRVGGAGNLVHQRFAPRLWRAWEGQGQLWVYVGGAERMEEA